MGAVVLTLKSLGDYFLFFQGSRNKNDSLGAQTPRREVHPPPQFAVDIGQGWWRRTVPPLRFSTPDPNDFLKWQNDMNIIIHFFVIHNLRTWVWKCCMYPKLSFKKDQ